MGSYTQVTDIDFESRILIVAGGTQYSAGGTEATEVTSVSCGAIGTKNDKATCSDNIPTENSIHAASVGDRKESDTKGSEN